MGTKENKIIALLLLFGSLLLLMGIFIGVSSSDPTVQNLNLEDNLDFEALQDRPPGGKPTDRTDRPSGSPPPRTITDPTISGGNNIIYSVAMPNALLIGGFIVLAFVVVFAVRQYNNISLGDTTRTDTLRDIYGLDDEVEVDTDAKEEPMSATEKAYEEARELATHDEWDRIVDTIETHLVESVDYKTNMTALVKIILPLRDNGEIRLSRRKITFAMWLLVKINLLVRNQEGEIAFHKDYENKVSYFLNEMNEHPSRKEKIEEVKFEENDDW